LFDAAPKDKRVTRAPESPDRADQMNSAPTRLTCHGKSRAGSARMVGRRTVSREIRHSAAAARVAKGDRRADRAARHNMKALTEGGSEQTRLSPLQGPGRKSRHKAAPVYSTEKPPAVGRNHNARDIRYLGKRDYPCSSHAARVPKADVAGCLRASCRESIKWPLLNVLAENHRRQTASFRHSPVVPDIGTSHRASAYSARRKAMAS